MSIDPPGPAQVPPPSELQPSHEPMGIAGMVTGIVGLVLCCCPYLGGFLGVVGLGLGIGSIVRVNQSPQSFKGKGFAIAGIATGAAAMILAIVLMVVGFGLNSGKFNDLLPKEIREQMERQRQGQGGAPVVIPPSDEVEPDEGPDMDRPAEEPADPQEPAAPKEPSQQP